MHGFLRARSPEEKAERQAVLLSTARALLEGGVAPQTLSLNELARRSGMAKANVYRYFETREAVLLALLGREWTSYFESFAAIGDLEVPLGLEALVSRLATGLAERPLLCALTAALPSVLEHNLSEATIRSFKADSLALLREAGAFLGRICPSLTSEQHARLLHDCALVITGLYPSTHPSASADSAMCDPALSFFRRDFRTDLERYLRALALDMTRGAEPGPDR